VDKGILSIKLAFDYGHRCTQDVYSIKTHRETVTSHLIGLRLNVLGHVNLVANQQLVIGCLAQRIGKNKVKLLLIGFIANEETAAI